MRDFAERIIALEMRGKSSGTKIPAAFYVFEKLRPHLATFMGGTGFHALLSRALAVANAEDPVLRMVRVREDGSLAIWDEGEVPLAPAVMAEASVVLVAQLLGLMVAFIGEPLTRQIAREIWPKLSFTDSDFRKGDRT
jgi:hypothetical protein